MPPMWMKTARWADAVTILGSLFLDAAPMSDDCEADGTFGFLPTHESSPCPR